MASSVGLLAISPPSRKRPKARKYEGAAPVARAARQTNWSSGCGGGTRLLSAWVEDREYKNQSMLLHQVSALLTYRSHNAQNVTGAGVITKQMKIDGFAICHHTSDHNLRMLDIRHHIELAEIIF